MNIESSRSHAIFTITVESSCDDENGCTHLKMGKLHLVDLAVSAEDLQYKFLMFLLTVTILGI